MESRYEDVPSQIFTMMDKIIERSFPELYAAKVHIIYNMKKKSSNGKIVFGEMKKATELLRFFTASNDNDTGVDYIMILDGNIFPVLDEKDQERIIRHELQHCEVDDEAKNPYKTRGHEIEDFFDEIAFNSDDPRWTDRVSVVAESVYDPENMAADTEEED